MRKQQVAPVLGSLVAVWLAWGALGHGAAAQAGPDSMSVGKKFPIASQLLGETRDVWVRLPEGYEDSQDRYPLLIQLGGDVHFAYSAAVVDLLARNEHVPDLIVVGLPDPTPRHHYRDSTPTRVDHLPASGGAPAFLRFLRDELIPHLEANYRTRPFRILCGHGLSGLFAVYAMLESPGTFGGIITDGASLTYDGSAILGIAETKAADPRLRGSLYLGVGNELETVPGIEAFVRLLERRASPGLEWRMEVEKDEDQGTASLPAFFKGLKWLFRSWRIPVEVASKGLDAVRAYYKGLSEKFGYEIPVAEGTLAGRGFQLIREQRFGDAAALFHLNVKAHPDSHRALQNLAFLYERTKDWKKAAEYYDQAAGKAAAAQPELAVFYRAQADRLRKRIGASRSEEQEL